MIVEELLNPMSIAIIGGSNDVHKPGGKILQNIIYGKYAGSLYVVNPKEDIVQGIISYHDVKTLPPVDLAIFAIAAKYIPDAIEVLSKDKGTKAFIILSAGFSEMGPEGKKLENKIVEMVNSVGGSLIGPNCIGVLSPNYKGFFAGPIPKYEPKGCDFVSSSGATICFILEVAIPRGISFSSIYSVGNAAQITVEDVLQHWDETYEDGISSKVKLIYMEEIKNPDKFLHHCRSLIQKGCRIAGIKAGTTDAGSRAVSSHTGALAGSDIAVDAIFKKAGVTRVYSRVELVYLAGILQHPKLKGDRIAVITHAGGSGVMLTDTLSNGGLKVPAINGAAAEELLTKLYHGSSVANPIDFLATGTAEQLGTIIDYVDNDFDNIDGSVVIFGTTGMSDVTDVYDVLFEKMKISKKPIFPVLPSVVLAAKAVNHFLSLGGINFTDEVSLGRALAKSYFTPDPADDTRYDDVDVETIRSIVENSEDGYLPPEKVQKLLDASGVPRVPEAVCNDPFQAIEQAEYFGFPIVMKVVGPIHKTEVNGVVLNIINSEHVQKEFHRLMKIEGATGVLIQPMFKGTELFIGAKYEPKFGHIIVCGLGGVFIEVLKDIQYGLAPLSNNEVTRMIQDLKSYKLIEGFRGKAGVNKEQYAQIIHNVSSLVRNAPEIAEMDINPLLGSKDSIFAVDARIRIEKNYK